VPSFTGKLSKKGKAITATVSGTLNEGTRPRSGVTFWDGTIIVAGGARLSIGEDYTLDLDDGRAGDIVILDIHQAGLSQPLVAFRGIGALA
jgi:hypothetical protein